MAREVIYKYTRQNYNYENNKNVVRILFKLIIIAQLISLVFSEVLLIRLVFEVIGLQTGMHLNLFQDLAFFLLISEAASLRAGRGCPYMDLFVVRKGFCLWLTMDFWVCSFL